MFLINGLLCHDMLSVTNTSLSICLPEILAVPETVTAPCLCILHITLIAYWQFDSYSFIWSCYRPGFLYLVDGHYRRWFLSFTNYGHWSVLCGSLGRYLESGQGVLYLLDVLNGTLFIQGYSFCVDLLPVKEDMRHFWKIQILVLKFEQQNFIIQI
jgi:hypothetical protein